MSNLSQILANHGAMLLGGITALLLAGGLATFAIRSPLLRQRIGELSTVATMVWIALACIPMRRAELWHAAEIPQPTQPPVTSPAPRAAPATLAIPSEILAKPSVAPSRPATAQPPLQAAVPLVVTQQHLNAPKLAANLFLIGAAVCIAWLMLGHLLLWRLIRRSSPAPASIARMLISFSPQRNVRVLISPTLARSVTCGLFRPAILLPATLPGEQSDQQLRQVLLHELGHIQQKDALGALIFNLALPLLYFHPLYWLLRRASALSRELVVDDWAARADGKEAYVTQLIALARSRVSLALSPVGSIGILQIRSHFYRRMHMLLHRNAPLSTRCSFICRAAMTAIAITIVAGLSCLLGVQPAKAQDASANSAPRQTTSKAGDPAVVPQPATNKGEAPAAASDPNLSVEERMRIRRAQANSSTIDSQMAELRSEGERIKHRLAELKTQAGPGELSPDDQKRISILNDKLAIIERQIVSLDQRKRDLANDPAAGEDDGGRPNPARARSAPAETRVSGVQLDLVNLANSTVDAWGAKRLAEARYARLSKLRETSVISAEELDIASVTFETAKKRLEILKGIAAIALQSAEQDLKLVKAAYETGMAGPQGVAEAEGKIKMLQMILNGAN